MSAERAIAVVSAGLSDPSSTRMLADRLAQATARGLGAQGVEAEVRRIELRGLAHDVTNAMLTGFAPAPLAEAHERVATADALIAVSPVFSAGVSGLFKSWVDVLDRDALAGMPVLLAATGGTARHSLVIEHGMRPLFAHLRADPVPTGVFAASADWGDGADRVAPLQGRIDRAAAELVARLAGSPARRAAADPLDPEAYLGAGRSFADLLGDLPARG
ncbi:CE1759 family FMN reductase [Microbacterium sp. gxy059]|uniref:CE1759 family FMN reductase n=1 Tax=Microbacterium sp. gxy059 TaxID=2957199 RepID=UPI003D976857